MKIFEKIYTWNSTKVLNEILTVYEQKGYAIVNYLYFANLISNWILGNKTLNKEFLNSLEEGDFLLPDGIALRLYAKKYFNLHLDNLNWTDFSEYVLQNLDKSDFNLIMYWAKKEVIQKAQENISQKYNIDIFYYQDWYSDFDFEKINSIWNDKINIVMVGLWTPLQEIWTKKNIESIKKYNLLVFTQGWTFDFWAWNEKRAPKIFINLKLEWLWRFVTNPKKNFKKVINSFYLFYYLLKK